MSSVLEKAVVRAARRILRPLVRLLLRNGFTALAFQELARKEFVDLAFAEFGIEGRPPTTSRVAILTGLSRKEVARLKSLAPLDESDQSQRNRAAAVLASWLIDSRFLDNKGDPLDLQFDGANPSFSDLVRAHSGDIPPRAIADELLRSGALEEIEGKYRMTRRGYVPKDDAVALVDILGMDTAEFMETIDHNIQAQDDRLLQAKVLAERLPAEHLPEFYRYSKQIARGVLQDLTVWLAQREVDETENAAVELVEVGFGLYQIVHREPTTLAGKDQGAVAKTEQSVQEKDK